MKQNFIKPNNLWKDISGQYYEATNKRLLEGILIRNFV